MNIKSWAVQGICSAILLGTSVAPVWADVVTDAKNTVKPATAAVNEAAAPAVDTVNDVAKPVMDKEAQATQPVTTQAEQRPSTLEERRAARSQADVAKTTEDVAATAVADSATTQAEQRPSTLEERRAARDQNAATTAAVAETKTAVSSETTQEESRPSTLEERRAARQQAAEKSVVEPTDYTQNYVEENLANPTIGVPTEGKVYQELSADLNHDQHIERVALIPFATSEYGDVYMRLTVFNDQNEIIYQSPKVTDCDNVKTFALYNAGECALQLLYDLDGDGNIELLESMPRSDVRPKPYRIWRWDGDKFIYLKDFTFQASARDRELFVFDEHRWDGVEDIAWLEDIAVRGGELKANVLSWKSYGMAQGKVVLEPYGFRGLKVKRWEKHILDMQL